MQQIWSPSVVCALNCISSEHSLFELCFLQSSDGIPLLVKAAEDGLEEFVDDLLQAGSNPNSKHLVQKENLF